MKRQELKVALVHDYLKEYGGAERVLQTLHEMFPEAPIYTAFLTPGSRAEREFNPSTSLRARSKIITSWADFFLRYKNLHSPLRFLIPLIWESFDFSEFDVVILSSSGYLTKPVRIPKHVKVICYCHTPPRFLYGYETSVEWQRYWPVKVYFHLVGHFLRLYDFLGAKRVDQFVANSKNTAARIEKFYRKSSVVVYPPVDIEGIKGYEGDRGPEGRGYYLIVSRIVGGKGIEMAMEAAKKLRFKLKVAGELAGLRFLQRDLDRLGNEYVEFLGPVSEEEKSKLMAGAKAFLALEKDVDFGITPVEAMAAGTPVVAYKSGGYLETVVEGKTGTFFEEYNVESLVAAMKRVQNLRFKKEDLRRQAEKFSKERFIEGINKIMNNHA